MAVLFLPRPSVGDHNRYAGVWDLSRSHILRDRFEIRASSGEQYSKLFHQFKLTVLAICGQIKRKGNPGCTRDQNRIELQKFVHTSGTYAYWLDSDTDLLFGD